jgi:phosphopantetheine--protein transferase-like protein
MTEKDKVRSVVARFFNVPETAVTEGYLFPPDRLHGSVGRATFRAAITRMAGVDLPQAFTATTFGQLFTPAPTNDELSGPEPANPPPQTTLAPRTSPVGGLGIDIEHCDHLPLASDPWTEKFYTDNFSPAEIAYCQRQSNPRESFCGLWSAKEAARKCHADIFQLRPLDLEITHDVQGRPFLTILRNGKPERNHSCEISISHSQGISIAACVTGNRPPASSSETISPAGNTPASVNHALVWLALGLSVLNLLLWLLLFFKNNHPESLVK